MVPALLREKQEKYEEQGGRGPAEGGGNTSRVVALGWAPCQFPEVSLGTQGPVAEPWQRPGAPRHAPARLCPVYLLCLFTWASLAAASPLRPPSLPDTVLSLLFRSLSLDAPEVPSVVAILARLPGLLDFSFSFAQEAEQMPGVF